MKNRETIAFTKLYDLIIKSPGNRDRMFAAGWCGGIIANN
jgi:hypothetical protein